MGAVQREGESPIILFYFIVTALFIVHFINRLTNTLCLVREIPEERQDKVFRFINVCILILLISSFVEISFTV
ncbi:hypothetical protein NYE57_15940 [Bacillus sp. FSL L8-0222]|uniref:hypothetical protein n=1 Tax=Bacillus sp. FSL L8-0222 TaxID=2975329 RepID=UPI0030FAE304